MLDPSGLSLVTKPLVCEFCTTAYSVPVAPAGTMPRTLMELPRSDGVTGEPMAVHVCAWSRDTNIPLAYAAPYSVPLGSTATALISVPPGDGLRDDHVMPPSTLRALSPE